MLVSEKSSPETSGQRVRIAAKAREIASNVQVFPLAFLAINTVRCGSSSS
jgi:hypothetical protein